MFKCDIISACLLAMVANTGIVTHHLWQSLSNIYIIFFNISFSILYYNENFEVFK